MPNIRPLESSVVNKIAAGEVIERPASVVKELVENAVDSGATRVDVVIEKGGAELIRVVDNGCGIAADELRLAVTNHATSKIVSADDLFQVASLGFRGEALASISAVSRFTLRSRPAPTPATQADAGAELLVNGGSVGEVETAGCPIGTTVEVRNLFFNTPVRQKFLRTPQTEVGHATEAFSRVALAHPEVHFTLSHNGRTVHDLPPVGQQHWPDRITALFGDEIAAALIEVTSEEETESGEIVRLTGYVANPQLSRANNRLQYLLLNGRPIRDRSLQHALGEAYRGLLLTGRQPICFLRLDMPPSLVDVNVHPTKLEVRFAEGGKLYSQLLATIRTKFLSSDLKPVSTPTRDDEVSVASGAEGELVSWAKNELKQQRLDLPHPSPSPFKPFEGGSSRQPLTMHRFTATAEQAAQSIAAQSIAEQSIAEQSIATPSLDQTSSPASQSDAPSSTEATEVSARRQSSAIQLHNRYLIIENEAGLEVIDQHALHERILYEQIRERVLAGQMETQQLLVPEPVDLTAEEAAAALENQPLLAQLGVEVQPFGGETVLVSSYPAMLANLPPAEVLRDLLEHLLAEGKQPEARDVLDSLLHSISCKAAVKYGDRLTAEEIDALLAARHLTENHHHCPHGRPTALVFTCEELDRRFQRT